MATPIPNNVIRPPKGTEYKIKNGKPIKVIENKPKPNSTEMRISILEHQQKQIQDELAMLRQFNNSKVKPAKNRLFLKDVLIAVCKYTDLNPHDILSPDRTAYLVRARSLFMNLCLELTGYGVTFIGRKCGMRDHTTVCYHEKQKAERKGHWSLSKDTGIKLWADYEQIRKQLLDAKKESRLW